MIANTLLLSGTCNLETHISSSGSEQCHCPVALGCVQDVVCDANKRYHSIIEVLV